MGILDVFKKRKPSISASIAPIPLPKTGIQPSEKEIDFEIPEAHNIEGKISLPPPPLFEETKPKPSGITENTEKKPEDWEHPTAEDIDFDIPIPLSIGESIGEDSKKIPQEPAPLPELPKIKEAKEGKKEISLPEPPVQEEKISAPVFPELPELPPTTELPAENIPVTEAESIIPSTLPDLIHPTERPPWPMEPVMREPEAKKEIFLKSNYFDILQNEIDEIKDTLKRAASTEEKVTELKNREDSDLNSLRICLESVQRKLMYIDKELFEKQEA